MSIDDFITAASKRVAAVAKRKANPLESTHEKTFNSWCNGMGIWCVKLVFFVGAGWPDRTLFCPGGVIIFVELKRDRDATLSTAQKGVRRRLRALGFTYIVGYGFADARKKVKKALKV